MQLIVTTPTYTRRLKCLDRLLKQTGCFQEIVSLLVNDKIVAADDDRLRRIDSNYAETLLIILEQAQAEDRLALLDFEWNILPVETISVTVVTPMQHREFTYTEP